MPLLQSSLFLHSLMTSELDITVSPLFDWLLGFQCSFRSPIRKPHVVKNNPVIIVLARPKPYTSPPKMASRKPEITPNGKTLRVCFHSEFRPLRAPVKRVTRALEIPSE